MKFDIIPLVLAAGKGVRMKSKYPKVVHHVCGISMIERVLSSVSSVCSEPPVVIIGSGADYVTEEIISYKPRLVYQKEQLGTGHAVMQARKELAESGKPVIILCGDTPLLKASTLSTLIKDHIASEAVATVVSAEVDEPAGYGRIIRSQHSGAFMSILEHRDCQEQDLLVNEINAGLYVVNSELLFQTLDRVGSKNDQGEFYLTDVFGILAADGLTVNAWVLPDPLEVLGVNSRQQLSEASAIINQRNCERLQTEGVTFVDINSVWVEDEVKIGMDTTIDPFVHLHSGTVIGEDCHIGTGSVIKDCTIGNNVSIKPYTVAEGAVVKDKATAGPFSRLREGAVLCEKSKVGNFVELKKTTLGEGSKASHLAYLGDTSIGKNVNIGAGTITCNYDGINKHPTNIGDEVFVGSNSTLVAPLNIEPRGYVAAGSTVNRTVPSDALAIGRSKQVNKEGYRKILDSRMKKGKSND